jgi:hypothetical protein
MYKLNDRVSENGRLGTVTAIHTKGTADVLFDDAEYAIRRQEHQLKPVRQNGGLTKRQRASLPDEDFCDIYTRKDGSERRAFPINDEYHGRLALTYATWPNNARKRQKVKKCVFARYPQLIEWWNNTEWVQDHPEEEYYEEELRLVANPYCPITGQFHVPHRYHPYHVHHININGGPYRHASKLILNPRKNPNSWLYDDEDDSY